MSKARSAPDRLIDSWIYKVHNVESGPDEDPKLDEGAEAPEPKPRVIEKTVKVEIYLEKDLGDALEPPLPTTKVNLVCRCRELDVSYSGTDIEGLRAAMWARLDEAFAIKWSSYYLVEIDKPMNYSGGFTEGLELTYDTVWKGITHDGKLLLKRYGSGRHAQILPWPGEFTDSKGTVIACIPAAPANEEALHEFSRRIALLRSRLADFLRPDKIHQTLANLAGFQLLPPSHEEQ